MKIVSFNVWVRYFVRNFNGNPLQPHTPTPSPPAVGFSDICQDYFIGTGERWSFAQWEWWIWAWKSQKYAATDLWDQPQIIRNKTMDNAQCYFSFLQMRGSFLMLAALALFAIGMYPQTLLLRDISWTSICVRAWIRHHIHVKQWDANNYPFNLTIAVVRVWMSKCIPQKSKSAITYPCCYPS